MNIQTLNEELRKKFKKMSPEQFEKYVHELQCMYMKEHPSLFCDVRRKFE